MEKESISLSKWEEYLKELFDWVSEKYDLLISNEITNSDYENHLEYYDSEKLRIENIIEEINREDVSHAQQSTSSKTKNKFTQSTFENFFGVTLSSEPPLSDKGNIESQKKLELNQFIPTPPGRQQPSNSILDKNIDAKSSDSAMKSKVSPTTSTTPVQAPQKIEVENQTITANILLIGDSSVGRTSLRRTWTGKHFIKNHLTTIGASIEKKTIDIDDWKYFITLTDLGGQDFYSDLRKNFYRNIDGAIIVFDLTSPNSFRRIDYWVKEFYRESKKLVPFVLVGNKYDLSNRVISEDRAKEVAEKFTELTMPSFKVRYLETSAKSGHNVNEIFTLICREIKSFKLQNRRKSQR